MKISYQEHFAKEAALLRAAARAGLPPDRAQRAAAQLAVYPLPPALAARLLLLARHNLDQKEST